MMLPQTDAPAAPAEPDVEIPDEVGRKVTNFEDLDFDAEDESVLRNAAMANRPECRHGSPKNVPGPSTTKARTILMKAK